MTDSGQSAIPELKVELPDEVRELQAVLREVILQVVDCQPGLPRHVAAQRVGRVMGYLDRLLDAEPLAVGQLVRVIEGTPDLRLRCWSPTYKDIGRHR